MAALSARYDCGMKFAACLFLCGFLLFATDQPVSVVFERAVQSLSAGNYSAAEKGFQSVLRA
jgi:hypothetical protein